MTKRRTTKGQREYMERLRDPRWQKLRLEVLEAAGWRCTWCGAGEAERRNLQIHHGFYGKNLAPWEYPRASLYVLCEPCHEQAESIKLELFEAQGLVPPWFHQHVYDFMVKLRVAIEQGEELDALAPWKPVRKAS